MVISYLFFFVSFWWLCCWMRRGLWMLSLCIKRWLGDGFNWMCLFLMLWLICFVRKGRWRRLRMLWRIWRCMGFFLMWLVIIFLLMGIVSLVGLGRCIKWMFFWRRWWRVRCFWIWLFLIYWLMGFGKMGIIRGVWRCLERCWNKMWNRMWLFIIRWLMVCVVEGRWVRLFVCMMRWWV